MTISLRKLSLSFLMLSIGVMPSAVEAAVALKSGMTEIDHSIVRLSDVFDGLPAGTDQDIASAPAPGHTITYNVNTLSYLAKQYKLEWKPASLSDHVVIASASSKVSSDDIAKAVIEKLKDQNVKGIIEVSFDNRALEINLPADRPPDFMLNNFAYDEVNRRFHADFVAQSDSGPVTMPIMGHIAIKHSVPVLARRLEAGSIIGTADIDWMSLPDDRMAGVIATAEELVGRELRRDTDGQQPLHEREVIQPRMVVRGNIVTMKIEMPAMVITAQGRALQDGAMGDVVRVNNTESSRMVEGTVAGPGLVVIHTPQKFAAVQ
jgi:flagella basal body P-ring formation protein FlgA